MKHYLDIYYKIRSSLINIKLSRYKNVKIGKKFCISNSIINYRSGQLTIGESFFMNRNSSINCRYQIIIGNNCIIGENVHIYDHNHIFSNLEEPVASQGFKNKPVIIGNNCWIATGVTILGGVVIGDNVVIGANCLIYKDIPSNSIVKNEQKLIIEDR